MLDLIIQRLKSKTFQTAFILTLISILEINVGFIAQFIPAVYRPYIVMVWPLAMLVLREMTKEPLSAK